MTDEESIAMAEEYAIHRKLLLARASVHAEELALAHGAVEGMSHDEFKESIYTMFDKLDIDGDGELTHDEIAKGLDGSSDVRDLLNQLMSGADQDGDGEVSVEEFIVYVDKDHDGNVTVLEFLQGIGALKHARKSQARLSAARASVGKFGDQREELTAMQGHLHHVSRASAVPASIKGRRPDSVSSSDDGEVSDQIRAARASAFQQEAESKSRVSMELANIKAGLIKVARASAADASAVAAAHLEAIEATKAAEQQHAKELRKIREHLHRLSSRLSASALTTLNVEEEGSGGTE